MAKVYDSEDLKQAEEKSYSPGGLSTSTSSGKVRYTQGRGAAGSPGPLSSSTSPGDIGYDSSPQIPPSERSLYNSSSTAPGKVRLGGFLSTRRRKIGIGVGGGVVAGGMLAFFFLFLPALRLEGYISTIDQRVFAATSNAVSKRVEHLFEGYMAGYVLALDKCGGKITVECRANYSKSGLASNLYKNWQDARIEEKLFDQYHFQLESLHNSSTADGAAKYVLKDPFGRKITLTNGDLRRGTFTGGSRELGNEVNKFLRDNTKWYQVMQRVSVRKYLVRKHGVKFWCFFACKTKDSIDAKFSNAKTKLKYKMVERVIYPMSPKLGLIMDCLINPDPGGRCSPESLRERGIDRSLLSDEELTDITKRFAENKSLSFSQLMIQKLLERVMEKETAQKSVSAIPVAGQIYLALSIIDMLNSADQCLAKYCLSHYAADLNSSEYLEYYTAMREANDEMKAGVSSADDVGALVDQFDDGGQPAEESLVYQTYTPTGPKTASLFSGRAYAIPSYLCANGQPIPAGQLVCPEKKVARTFKIEDIRNNNIVSGLEGILNTYQACPTRVTISGRCLGLRPVTIVHPLLKGIDSISSTVLGPLAEVVVKGFSSAPGLKNIISSVKDRVGDFINGLLGKVFPLPVQVDSPGRDKWDGLEAGGEVAASEFNKGGYTAAGQAYGLGGKLLTDKQDASAAQAYLEQSDYDSAHGSLMSRIASIDNPGSLLSRFVAAMPTSWSGLSDSFAQILSSPLHSAGVIFHPAYAAASDINAFGIPRFGYTANDPAFNADPSIYTPEYCQQLQKKWEASKTDNPETGIDEYSITNPCLLEQVSVEAASAVFSQNESLDN